MSPPIAAVAPTGRRDLDHQVLWFHSEAGPDTAQRFAAAAIATFAKLAQAPGLGTPVAARSLDLAKLRKWRVDGFPNILFFYRPTGSGIDVVRVLHAASDWKAALESD